MRSPADMQTIQIEITNACNKHCSNCTRFCGNHKKSFFMDYETFCRALSSLDGFDGVKGIMGGEPTLHPEFERFAHHIQDKFGLRRGENRLVYPQRNFIKEIRRREFESHILYHYADGRKTFKMSGPGLWSNMGESYRRHYEIIQDTFYVQFLNDHLNPSYHQPGLFARKDLNLPDDVWVKLRDKCWIQNEWSASITPKGAFFCEIAAALDMLFDGPGGWKIEPNWWRRTPEEFGDQLHWCELCGFALDTFMRDAKDEQDDVSPTLYKKLKEIQSPRLLSGHTNLVKIDNGVIAEESKAHGKHFSAAQPYIEHYEDRFNEKNSLLFVKNYHKIYISEDDNFGRKLNRELKYLTGWVLLSFKEEVDEGDLPVFLRQHVLNPGTLHIGKDFVLFSMAAMSLRRLGYDLVAHARSVQEIIAMWQPTKVIYLTKLQKQIKGKSVTSGRRYALWGAGMSGGFIAEEIRESAGQLIFVVDTDQTKYGQSFYGVPIHAPEYLSSHGEDYDFLIIGHYTRFQEIEKAAVAMGITQDRIILPYEV